MGHWAWGIGSERVLSRTYANVLYYAMQPGYVGAIRESPLPDIGVMRKSC